MVPYAGKYEHPRVTRRAFQAEIWLFEHKSVVFLLLDARLEDWSNAVPDYGKEQ
jgi:hypothetical protein